jgi:predicted NAD/FAD-dependent oxidoreductase
MAAGSVVRLTPERRRRHFDAAREAEVERLRAAVEQLRRDRDRLARELEHAQAELARARHQTEAAVVGSGLKRRLREAGIPQDAVARAALVTKAMVSHVLAGRAVSRPVVEAAERLLAESHHE